MMAISHSGCRRTGHEQIERRLEARRPSHRLDRINRQHARRHQSVENEPLDEIHQGGRALSRAWYSRC